MFHTTLLPSRRVLIIGDDLLFEEALTRLLTYGTNLSVTGAKYTDDPAFLEDVAQQQPDVILLNEESKALDSAHVLDLIFSTPALITHYVIVVRLSSSMIDVYENGMSKRFMVTKPDQLVSVVRGEFQRV